METLRSTALTPHCDSRVVEVYVRLGTGVSSSVGSVRVGPPTRVPCVSLDLASNFRPSCQTLRGRVRRKLVNPGSSKSFPRVPVTQGHEGCPSRPGPCPEKG